MRIIGAGLAGLIAASMLRNQCSEIMEAAEVLPNNHAALLRFRTGAVADATGIPFDHVRVMKSSHPWRNPVADAMAYSFKCTGQYGIRSITSAQGDIDKRFIAPDDFINQLYEQIGHSKFVFGKQWYAEGAAISTMPMPALMSLLEYPEKPVGGFTSVEGWVLHGELDISSNVYATVYVPNPRAKPYRVSVTGKRLIVEGSGILGQVNKLAMAQASLKYLGIDEVTKVMNIETKRMKYSKIVPIDEKLRKRFIVWASLNHKIYSLGRFATWRPGLLLDDVVNDVRVIQRMMTGDATPTYESNK